MALFQDKLSLTNIIQCLETAQVWNISLEREKEIILQQNHHNHKYFRLVTVDILTF